MSTTLDYPERTIEYYIALKRKFVILEISINLDHVHQTNQLLKYFDTSYENRKIKSKNFYLCRN